MAALVHHLWSYINGRFDSRSYGFNYPYAGGTTPPSFIGNDYYCESGTADTHSISAYHFDDLTHCGMELAASLVDAVTTLPSHGFTDSYLEAPLDPPLGSYICKIM